MGDRGVVFLQVKRREENQEEQHIAQVFNPRITPTNKIKVEQKQSGDLPLHSSLKRFWLD
jgi:hypothetical protein